MVSAKCFVPWILEFVVLSTGTNNEKTSSISMDLNFSIFSLTLPHFCASPGHGFPASYVLCFSLLFVCLVCYGER